MKFGISNIFVLCAILLSVDTIAAPVQVINARDESTLAVRAPLFGFGSAPKPAAAPQKAPVPAAPNKAPASAASCSLPKSNTAKPKTIKGRVVATTQFHATCKNFATSIETAVRGGTFALQAKRIWPNEFTWSGGFYVTPDKDKAELFGATFLGSKCATKGGVVIMEFELNQTGLQLNEVPGPDLNVDKFRAAHARLGKAIQLALSKLPQTETTPAETPADENISTDDNPAGLPSVIALPTQQQLDAVLALKGAFALNAANLKTLNDFKTVDVVTGAGSFSPAQKVAIEDAVNSKAGIPELVKPFNQVVLVTDKAMRALRFVATEDLQKCLADAQPLLAEFLKQKDAKQKAEDAAAEAAKKASGSKTPPRR